MKVKVRKPIRIVNGDLGSLDVLDYDACRLHVSKMENAVVTRSGATISRYGTPILKSTHYTTASKWQNVAISYASLLRRGMITGSADYEFTFGHNVWCGGYFHWVTEGLIRLNKVKKKFPNANIILPPYKSLRRVYSESVQLLGFDLEHRIFSDRAIKVPRLIFCDNPPTKGQFVPADIIDLRNTIFKEMKMQPDENSMRLYISRQRSRGRKIQNEFEFNGKMKEYGFTEVFLEDLSFTEQIELFRSAACVIGVHGAGLTNVVWMNPGSTVIELTADPKKYSSFAKVRHSYNANPSYLRLSSIVGAVFGLMFCDVSHSENELPNLIVDTSSLDDILHDLNIKPVNNGVN